MKRRLIMMIMTVLLVSQTIIGPLSTHNAFAQETDNQTMNTEANATEKIDGEAEKPIEQQPIEGGEVQSPDNNSEEDNNQTTPPPVITQPETKENVETSEQENKVEEVQEEKVEETAIKAADPADFVIDVEGVYHLISIDGQGNVVYGDRITTENPLAELTDNIYLAYNWSLKNGHGFKAGDTTTFNLPSQLKIDQPISGSLGEYGTFYINTNGVVTFTFTEEVEQNSDITGTFWFASSLKEDVVITEDDVVVLDPIKEGSSVVIPVKSQQAQKSIDKQGYPSNDGYRSETIDWEINLDVTKNKIQESKFIDEIPAGLALVEGTLLVDGQPVSNQSTDNNKIELALGDFQGKKKITYQTKIVDKKITSFTNKASLEDNKLQPVDATSTVTIKYGDPINKGKGLLKTDEKTGKRYLEWQVELNYDEQNLSNVLFSDYWGDAPLTLIEDSVKFTVMTFKDGKMQATDQTINFPVTSKANGFEIPITTDQPLLLTYRTEANIRPIDDINVQNTAKLGETTSTGEGSIRQQVGYKWGNRDVDYKDQTIEWGIVANQDKQKSENVVITDTYTNGGLWLKADSVTVRHGEEVWEAGKDFDVEDNGKLGFTISFNRTVTDVLDIRYKTHFNPNEVKDLNAYNKANFKWEEDGKPYEKDLITNVPLNDETKNQGYKGGTYDVESKEITWSLGVNYRQNNYEKLIVKDTVGEDQKILPDSFVVTEQFSGDVINIKPTIDGQNITFDFGKTTKAYNITYKTSLEGLPYIAEKYTNTALFGEEGNEDTKLDASVGITGGGKYVTKSASKDGKTIDWKVTVNEAQATVQNAKLKDTLSEDQEYLPDSVQITDAAGNVLEKGKDYTITFTEDNRSFTVAFSKTIDRQMTITYSTLFFIYDGEVKNGVEFTGDQVNVEKNTTEESVEIREQTGGGTANGKTGKLRIIKEDADTSALLAGAEFELRDATSGRVLKKATSNNDGEVFFKKLLFGDYLLVETKAPTGYLLQAEPIRVTVKNMDDPNEVQVEKVENHKLVYEVELTKIDPVNKLCPASLSDEECEPTLLADVEFELYRQDNDGDRQIGGTYRTNQAGKIHVKDLAPGQYYFVETKVPEGYPETNKGRKFTFEIKADALEPVEITAENLPYGTVSIYKYDKYTQNALAGVEFELQKKNEDGEYKAVNKYTTDQDGLIFTEKLADGDYQFVETKALYGYKPLTEPVQFTISSDKKELTYYFDLANEANDTAVTLEKVDEDNPTLKLQGAQFELYKKGDTPSEDQRIENGDLSYFETDANGRIIVEQLAYGQYYFKEVKAPAGYDLNAKEYKVTLQEGKHYLVTATNKESYVPPVLPKAKVTLTKVDAKDPTLVLEDAHFELYKKNTDGDVRINNGTETYFVTNAEGKITVGELTPGQYYFKEVKAPTGYVLGEVTYTFEAKDNQHAQVVATNTKETMPPIDNVKVTLTKVDADDATLKLQGAKFELYKKSATGDTLVGTYDTNQAGQIVVENLAEGDYYFKEVKAPTGYEKGDTTYPFTGKEGAHITITATNKKTIVPPQEKTKVTLTKVDADKHAKTLAGAKFELYKKSATGDTLVGTYDTNQAGQIVVENLAEGDYYFKEVKAPKGYKLNASKYGFTIVATSDEKLTVTNEREPRDGEDGDKPTPPDKGNPDKPNPPTTVDPNKPGPGGGDKDKPTNPNGGKDGNENPSKLPQTDGQNQTMYIVLGFVLMALSIAFYVRRRQAQNK